MILFRHNIKYYSPEKLKAYFKGYFIFIALDKTLGFGKYKVLVKSPEGIELVKEIIQCPLIFTAIQFAFRKAKIND